MKNFLNILIAVSICTQLNAQLTVGNDSFLFVSDQIIFVQDNVNLTQVSSKMYLRDEAQLIQGSGNSGNSGLGELSIQQRGTTHEFAYNYWCSPIGQSSSDSGNDFFKANLIDESTGLTASNDVAFTADSNGFTSPLTISRIWIYTFENSDQYSAWNYKGSNGTISPGLGFTMKGINGSDNNQLYDFRGKPNNGTITNSVAENLWTLIGNPYPSAIDAVAFIHDADNTSAITGVLYFWEQDLTVMSHFIADYVGGYAKYTINADGDVETFTPAVFNTYNGDGSINGFATTTTNSTRKIGRYIPVGQGFMVEGKESTSGVVTVKNSHRKYQKESTTNGQFFRTAQSNQNEADFSLVPQDYKRFRINIDFNDIYTRQLVQTFHDTKTTSGFDIGFDVKHDLGFLSSDAYWMTLDDAYTAQAMPLDIQETVLPITISLSTKQNLRIRIADIQNFEDDQPIYLHDNLTGLYTNLRNQDFDIFLNDGNYSSRFEIVFSTTILTNSDYAISDVEVFHNITNHELNIYNFNSYISNIRIFDMLGKEIVSLENLGKKSLHTITTAFLNSGIYIAKIKSKDKIVTKKFVVK